MTNQTSGDLAIISSRSLIAGIVDPYSDAVVGGYSGFVIGHRTEKGREKQ